MIISVEFMLKTSLLDLSNPRPGLAEKEKDNIALIGYHGSYKLINYGLEYLHSQSFNSSHS